MDEEAMISDARFTATSIVLAAVVRELIHTVGAERWDDFLRGIRTGSERMIAQSKPDDRMLKEATGALLNMVAPAPGG
jgi:hypothetical protein